MSYPSFYLHSHMMQTTSDQLYLRLKSFGVNVDAVRKLNLSSKDIEDFCQRIERLLHEEMTDKHHEEQE